MAKVAVQIALSVAERRALESLARAHKAGQAMARRARIVLAAAAGLENKAICTAVGTDSDRVSKWRRRFAAHRLDGLLDEPRPGTPRKIGDDKIVETIRPTLETAPPDMSTAEQFWCGGRSKRPSLRSRVGPALVGPLGSTVQAGR